MTDGFVRCPLWLLITCFLWPCLLHAADTTAETGTKRILVIGNYRFAQVQRYLAPILEASDFADQVHVAWAPSGAHATAAHNYDQKVGLTIIAGNTTEKTRLNKHSKPHFIGKRPDLVILQVDPARHNHTRQWHGIQELENAVAGYAETCTQAGCSLMLAMTPGIQLISQRKHGKGPITPEAYDKDLQDRNAILAELGTIGSCPVVSIATAYAQLREHHHELALAIHRPIRPHDTHASCKDLYFTALVMAAAIIDRKPAAIDIVEPSMYHIKRSLKRGQTYEDLPAGRRSLYELSEQDQVALNATAWRSVSAATSVEVDR